MLAMAFPPLCVVTLEQISTALNVPRLAIGVITSEARDLSQRRSKVPRFARDDTIFCSRSSATGLKQLPELRLENLAVVVLGQRLDELVVLGPLEARDIVEAELIELGGRQGLAAACHYEGHDLLAPFGMRAAHHRAFGDGGMEVQHVLDLARIDVGAAGDDHVLGAV